MEKTMKTLIKALGMVFVLSLPLTSQALTISVFLDNPAPVLTAPTSGSMDYMFTGTIQITGAPSSGSIGIEAPYLATSNSDYLTVQFAPSLQTQAAGLLTTPNSTYTGDLFKITIDSTTPIGEFNHSVGTTTAPVIAVYASAPDGSSAYAAASYGATVSAVPEPATLAFLVAGIGGFVASRRRVRH